MVYVFSISFFQGLPPDTLSGHRSRFNQEFSRFKELFFMLSTEEYVYGLIFQSSNAVVFYRFYFADLCTFAVLSRWPVLPL